ncbi:hypothetical protein EW146_g275 [Bondarzewia mesenterica]|uniref:Uncharacterized protein n=1 Tax=Bondarzewia mesenterica TaxID=1095465 RepID=A0A4S4M7C2_9AGAM|nr:hypothetical protein EW146_g275 [Bondarzewia mesenterica]
MLEVMIGGFTAKAIKESKPMITRSEKVEVAKESKIDPIDASKASITNVSEIEITTRDPNPVNVDCPPSILQIMVNLSAPTSSIIADPPAPTSSAPSTATLALLNISKPF